MKVYAVRTACTGTVRERWIVRSPLALDAEDIESILYNGGDEERGITLECEETETDDEEDRQILDIDDESEDA